MVLQVANVCPTFCGSEHTILSVWVNTTKDKYKHKDKPNPQMSDLFTNLREEAREATGHVVLQVANVCPIFLRQ